MTDSLLLSSTHILTYRESQPLTNASGFFFKRDEQLWLVTSRHVLLDEASDHFPDQLQITFHIDRDNMASITGYSIPLYQQGMAVWRQGGDTAGDVDVAVIPIDRSAMPASVCYTCFTPEHLLQPDKEVSIGSSLLIVGSPLGFYDTLHHLPVVRHAINASPFNLRFQGQGYFLTDARTHSGISGAPVVIRATPPHLQHDTLPWALLGVHSARLEVGNRDEHLDEALGLNCAWYADILMTLTTP